MKIPPLVKEIPFESPYLIYQRLRSVNSCLLESGKGPEQIARYSFIGIDPYLVFSAKGGTVEIETAGKRTLSSRKPLQRLRELVAAYSQENDPDLPPFQGGAMGMFSYDFVQYLEQLPSAAEDDLHVPDAHFFMVDRVVSFDHRQKRCWIIVCPGARNTAFGFGGIQGPATDYLTEAAGVLNGIVGKISAKCTRYLSDQPSGRDIAVTRETSQEEYARMVMAAKEYIAAGDIFQANLSLRLSAGIGDLEPLRIYHVLREVNPSPFAAFFDFGDYQIASSSPERLVRVMGQVIETRPIAGTRPRGRDKAEDEHMRSELLLNEKERAEHIMLIDLERNDIGRVSDYGTVTVDELMITEDYSHVIHIVSNVRGMLAAGKDCFDVIRATFPGGTITGVPKVRCMEIIDEIEKKKRGPYTGSLGYIGFSGNMDLNIIIRTFLIKDGKAYVQAGAGIVADSDPEREYLESLKKAEALIRTLELV